MENTISITELVPYSPEELLGKEDYFLEKIKTFIDKVRKERTDLDNYRLNDVGFIPKEDAVLIKLYFKWDHNAKEQIPDKEKIIDIRQYLST
ncbi:hypothetical protein [Natranaerobius thermophilus]|uniref:Uncharacterized protein n=1 Tax=Natranaerobius thermophilus (strain ATCC BAA-1301 / DSM 18059 / JW/NM-WN-LF) TaxID=457570 RepID=B2A568_NATTJ|nr:hypothetical protein [Natranaerobius thermophilus]ACB85309.1 hypothetical protein Nther_1735 [Natranaerobius thermophilus JW/NM-WN-LF]